MKRTKLRGENRPAETNELINEGIRNNKEEWYR